MKKNIKNGTSAYIAVKNYKEKVSDTLNPVYLLENGMYFIEMETGHMIDNEACSSGTILASKEEAIKDATEIQEMSTPR